MAQLTSFPDQDRIRVLAADNTSMNTQLLVETLGRDSQFHVASPVAKEADILTVLKRERSDVALISARQGADSRGARNRGACDAARPVRRRARGTPARRHRGRDDGLSGGAAG